MRPGVARAVCAAGGGPWLLSFDVARRSLQTAGQLRQPIGGVARGQSEPGSERFPDGRLVFGAAFAVQP